MAVSECLNQRKKGDRNTHRKRRIKQMGRRQGESSRRRGRRNRTAALIAAKSRRGSTGPRLIGEEEG